MKENMFKFEKEKNVSIEIAKNENLKDIQKLCHKLCIKERNEFDSTINEDYPVQEVGKKYFKERIESGCALVAIVDNKVVGYLVGANVQQEDYRIITKLAEAESMFVEEEYRNLGIEKKLFDRFIEWSKLNGVQRVRAIASAENARGIEFYEREGLRKYNVVLEGKINNGDSK